MDPVAARMARRGGSAAPARRATYQDVLDAPAHRVAEIVDGTLHTYPRPAAPHALAKSSLGTVGSIAAVRSVGRVTSSIHRAR